MPATLARLLTVTFAAAFLAALSVVSAYEMAPDRDTIEQQQAALVLGATLEDFCGTEHLNGNECPFCHKLPEPPVPSAPVIERRLVFTIVPGFGRDLVIGPLHLHPDAAPRAPPYTV